MRIDSPILFSLSIVCLIPPIFTLSGSWVAAFFFPVAFGALLLSLAEPWQ